MAVVDRDAEAATAVAAEIEAAGGRARGIGADVTDPAAVTAAAEAAAGLDGGTVHVVVNNAGVVRAGDVQGPRRRALPGPWSTCT